MLKICHVFILLGMLLCSAASAAQVSIGIGLPNVSIGINLSSYPRLVAVPGYPVYYAPRLNSNYFFYDGMYWVYQDDNWYESNWYNGPWWLVDPEVVPVFILRIPVRYYRQPPAYFRGWRSDAPPRWGDHWGSDWEQRRSGWNKWNRRAAPAPAPLPVYQRQYSGERYPQQVEQQHEIQKQKYRYQSRDPIVKQHYQEQTVQIAPAQRVKPQQEKQGAPEKRDSKQQDLQRPTPRQQDVPAAPRAQAPQNEGVKVQQATPAFPQQGHPKIQDQEPAVQIAPARQEKPGAPDEKGSKQQDLQRPTPRQQVVPAAPPQKEGVKVQQATPASPQQGRPKIQDQRQQPQPKATPEQQIQKAQKQKEQQQNKDTTHKPKPGQEQEQERGPDRKE